MWYNQLRGSINGPITCIWQRKWCIFWEPPHTSDLPMSICNIRTHTRIPDIYRQGQNCRIPKNKNTSPKMSMETEEPWERNPKQAQSMCKGTKGSWAGSPMRSSGFHRTCHSWKLDISRSSCSFGNRRNTSSSSTFPFEAHFILFYFDWGLYDTVSGEVEVVHMPCSWAFLKFLKFCVDLYHEPLVILRLFLWALSF